MLTAEGCLRRQIRLWRELPAEVDVVLVTSPAHLTYLSNFHVSPFVFRGVNAGAALLLERGGGSTLVADNVLQPFIDEAFVAEKGVFTWYRGQESAGNRGLALASAVAEHLRRLQPRMLGYEAGHAPTGIFASWRPPVGFVPIDDVMLKLRRAKDADELALIRRSVHAGEQALAFVRQLARASAMLDGCISLMNELDLYQLVQTRAQAVAGEPALVYGDFVSGPRCEQGGGPPTSRKVERGDLALLDFSTVVRGYRADFASTFVWGGDATSRQRELYAACLAAMRAGQRLLRTGTPADEVDRAVRGAFEERGLNQYFGHHVGHGIGLGHPEAPFFVPNGSDVLLAGDVVTLEPGLYVPGVGGIRIERNYLITDDGYELLTRHELALEA